MSQIETATHEEVIETAMKVIIIIILITLAIFLSDRIYNQGKIIRSIVCGLLFWLPGGAITQIVSGGCAAIPV